MTRFWACIISRRARCTVPAILRLRLHISVFVRKLSTHRVDFLKVNRRDNSDEESVRGIILLVYCQVVSLTEIAARP